MRKNKKAFSLVELVIVVVIIGVIAAIAVPRISRGAKGAGDSSLRGTLAGVRNAIDMYAAEHGGTFPAGLEAEILDRLTLKTDAAGTVGTTAGVHIYGPYLRGVIPPLPVGTNKGDSSLKIVTGAVVPGVGLEGWIYSTDTGEFVANLPDTDTDESGIQYNAY
ncbi:MAG: prepilin-type N-terminal cleavage/methylation domain-containing protein [Planctomycetota bacterium]